MQKNCIMVWFSKIMYSQSINTKDSSKDLSKYEVYRNKSFNTIWITNYKW